MTATIAFLRHLSILLLPFVFATGANAGPALLTYYVAPNGFDGNPGTIDRPLATLQAARDRIRLHVSDEPCQDVIVYIRGGTYRISEPLDFDTMDSGVNGHVVCYEAYKGESVVLSGGRRVSGFRPYHNGVYVANLQSGPIRQLYVNGRRAVLARYPNLESNADFGPYLSLVNWDKSKGQFITTRADGVYAMNARGAEMILINDWDQAILRIGQVSVSDHDARITPEQPEGNLLFNESDPHDNFDNAYYIQNSLGLLDSPGEWYFDSAAGKLYYKPRHGERVENADVEVPVASALLDVNGASNLHFEGIRFECSQYELPNDMRVGGQANVRWPATVSNPVLPGAIQIRAAVNVGFRNDSFCHLGATAVELAYGDSHCFVDRCLIDDVSGNGIDVYTLLKNQSEYVPDDANRCSYNSITNNVVSRVGQDYTGAAGIFVSFTCNTVVDHNEVYNCPYVGISFGWHGGDTVTANQGGSVSYNNVHDIAQLHPDTGGIYTLGNQQPPNAPGLTVKGNYIHDIHRSPWARTPNIVGIYLDNYTSGATVIGNVIEDIDDANILISPSAHNNDWINYQTTDPSVISNAGPTGKLKFGEPGVALSNRRRLYISSGNHEYDSVLMPGSEIYSPNGKYHLDLQWDGDFALRDAAGRQIWHTDTGRRAKANYRVTLQGDSNLVLTLQGPVVNWSSATGSGRTFIWNSSPVGPDGDYYLCVSNAGKAEIHRGLSPNYDAGVLWSKP